MRNLLGRLNARSDDDLIRIATNWRVPVSGRDRHSIVGQLYRELRDPRTVRDAWDALPEDERDAVRLLAVTEHAPEVTVTIAELAALLETDEATARNIATRLYQKAILAREGGDDPLPAGEAPRLFLPRELALLFRRVQDEIEAGDVSKTPLRVLMSLLEDWEVERAAEIWGLRVIPGLRTRTELTDQLLDLIGDPQRIEQVTSKLSWDARRLWNHLSKESPTEPMALDAAAAAIGLDGDDARRAHRLRQALSELEEGLLVWHTYDHDGGRGLFIPAELKSPGTRPVTAPSSPATMSEENITPPAWAHPDRVAWDLLTLLRAIHAPGAPRIRKLSEAPSVWLRRLNQDLWNRGADLPVDGYLDLLVALGKSEGVLTGGDEASDAALTLGRGWPVWRRRSFPEQTARLAWWWLANPSWIEAADRGGIDVWGATWPPFRRKLVALLASLEAGPWYPISDLATWLAARDLDMLGDTVRIAISRPLDPALDDTARRRMAIAAVIEETLTTSFHWFGLVELGVAPRQRGAIRITPALLDIAESRSPGPATETRAPALTVTEKGEITLRVPTPLRVWSLSAFSETVSLGSASRYRITEATLRAALTAGFDVDDVVTFIKQQSGKDVPPDLEQRLRTWAKGFRRLRLRRLVEIVPDDRSLSDDVRRLAEAEGWTVFEIEGKLIVELPATQPPSTPQETEEQLFSLLRRHHFAPQWQLPAPPPANRRDERDGIEPATR